MKSRKSRAKAERGGQPVATAPRTEGQRLLLAVTGSQSEIAATIGVAKSAVGFWRRGTKTPGPAARAKLKAAYGIDPRTWEQPPGASATAPASSPDAKAPPTSDAKAPHKPPRAPRAKIVTTLDEAQEQFEILRELQEDPTLMPSEKVRLADSIGKILAIKARLEREKELLEDRIVREHPMWALRIKPAILSALKPYPDAMRAVADALAEIGE